MINKLTTRMILSGMLALAVVSTTAGISTAVTTEPAPVATVTPQAKEATIVWKNLDTTINKRSTSTGLSGQLIYNASAGATGIVSLRVTNLKPGATTWTEIYRATIDARSTSYVAKVRDINYGLSSGTVKYRVEATVSNAGTRITLPADIAVDYTKTATSIVGNKLTGKTLVTDSLNPFKVTGKISGTIARNVYVQRYDAKKSSWDNISGVYAYPAKTFYVSIPQTKATETYRTYVPATLTQATHYGPATAVKRTSPKGQFFSTLVSKKRIVPWETNTAGVYVASRLVQGEIAPTVTLQGIVRGKWTNISSVKKQGRITFTLPKGSTRSSNVTQTYRYVVGASRFSDAAISGAFRVLWDNPYKYTGMRRTAYNYAAKYCPNMMIDVKRLPPNIAGLAYMGRGVTELSPYIPAHDLRTVALHECAHHRQWQLEKSSFSSFRTKINGLYRTSGNMGIEYNADCIANVWYRNSYWGYNRPCSGAQLTAAKIMASGRKI